MARFIPRHIVRIAFASGVTALGLMAIKSVALAQVPNNPPVANNDVAATAQGTPVNIDVLANDSTEAGETLAIASVTQPEWGSVTVSGDGLRVVYTTPEYTVGDSFTYTISDGNGGSDSATVKVAVNQDNDPSKGSIRGRVTDQAGSPIFGVSVHADADNYTDWAQAFSDLDGTFRIPSLEAGAYGVYFRPDINDNYVWEYYNDTRDYSARTLVTVVSGQETVAIDASLSTGGIVRGRVTNSAGAPIPGVSVSLSSGWSGQDVTTGADGTYEVLGLETKSYLVEFSPFSRSGDDPPVGNYLREYYDNSHTFEGASQVAVVQGAAVVGIDAQLETGGVITGRVTDESANPIQGVNVSTDWSSRAITDANGQYSLIALETGNHRLSFSSYNLNYIGEFYNDKSDYFEADLVSVVAGQTTSGIDASLAAGAVITGRVTDDAASPIAGINVWAVGVSGSGYGYSAATAADGTYRMQALPAGDYKVRFESYDLNYVTEYYNNKPDSASADVVHLAVAGTVSGVDAAMQTGGTIRGSVTNARGEPVRWASVSTRDGSGSYWSNTDATGSFVIDALPTGSYRVYFQAPYQFNYVSEYYNNRRLEGDADLVAVTAGAGVSGINAQLEDGGSITGRVTDEAGLPVANAWVNANGGGPPGVYRSATTNTQGNYTIVGLPTGDYRVQFEGSYGSGLVTEYYNNKSSYMEANLVSVTEGQSTSGIDAQLATGGSITGTVTGPTGQPLSNASVHATNLDASGLSEYTWTDSSGNYTLRGLPGGSYRVGFDGPYRSNYAPEWFDNKTDYNLANPVAVTQGSVTAGINAQLSDGGTITGRVTNTEGQPIVGVWVSASSDAGSYSGSTTDSLGRYTIERLNTAIYRVYFSPPYESNYRYEYYNDQSEYSKANLVAATAGGSVSGIDAILEHSGTPDAYADEFSATEDTTLSQGAPGVLVNDYDPDNSVMQALLETPASHGTVLLNTDGSFEYTPEANFNGSDSFTYRATDGQNRSRPAVVTIQVQPVNDPPVAIDDQAVTQEDTSVDVPVAANDSDPDGDPLVFSVSTPAANGTAVCTTSGVCTYTPGPDFTGQDSFGYSVTDGLSSSSATVTILVTSINDLPAAQDDIAYTALNTAVIVNVVANDTDPDGDQLSVTLASNPSNGTVVCSAAGICTYTPNFAFFGLDSFTYEVADGNGGTDTATVTITVGLLPLPLPL
ncbi:MAG: carboxypeptidase regulatory-like domain-containing protein [Actinomycetota bacterium]